MDQYFIELKQQLRVSDQQKQDILSELQQHIQERTYALQLTGLPEQAAQQQAWNELDSASSVARQFNQSYRHASLARILAYNIFVFVGITILAVLLMMAASVTSLISLFYWDMMTIAKIIIIFCIWYRSNQQAAIKQLNWQQKLFCIGTLAAVYTLLTTGFMLWFFIGHFPDEGMMVLVSFIRNFVILMLAQVAVILRSHFSKKIVRI